MTMAGKQRSRAVIALIALLLCGCSYYGSDTFLVPDAGNRSLTCNNMRILIQGGIRIDQTKVVYAFAGLPYFPAIPGFPPPQLGNLNVRYSNIRDLSVDICTVHDLTLHDGRTSSVLAPISVWKSALVEKNGAFHLGCEYNFGDGLEEAQSYAISFRSGFLGCMFPEIPLEIKKDRGYHQVLVQ